MLASSKASYKRPRKTEAAVDVDVARSRIWEISRKSYENWLAKVAQRVCLCVCVPNCTNICAIYTHTHMHRNVCVCEAKVELESRRGEASLESLLAEGKEKKSGEREARRVKSRRESGVGSRKTGGAKSGLGLWSRECSRY